MFRPKLAVQRRSMITIIILSSLIIPFTYIVVALVTFILASITWISFSKYEHDNSKAIINTALYCGRVSHTRYQPVVHAFSYPLFFCLLDLSEVNMLFRTSIGKKGRAKLWPLNLLMTFRDEDHLKNGEGLAKDSDNDHDNDLSSRVRRLVSDRTKGKCKISQEQKIFILTHLCYYGYCFNPVSFYYILKGDQFNDTIDDNDSIEAIVAEVSNTPWNEMKCYVLHPDSCDMKIVQEGRSRKVEDKPSEDWKSINYIFEKKFHVSPFMEMDYIYDWTFWQMRKEKIVASTTMIKLNRDKQENTNDNGKSFNAFFDINRAPFNPFSLCYQLIKFPIYCFIIQIWIHYEALKLFVKGVEFIPHPEGSETRVSALIASIMEPFFVLKGKLESRRQTQCDGLKTKMQ